MASTKYYRYNPETDDFERVFPTMKSRLKSAALTLLAAAAIGVGLFFIFRFFESPSERMLKEENAQLRSNYSLLNKRLDDAIKVMDNIRNRDDNLYRVVMHIDPVNRSSRLAGLDNQARYKNLENLGDAQVVELLSREMDYLDRQIYAQSLSFDELNERVVNQQGKLSHIPGIMPLRQNEYRLSSGYGTRRDPFDNQPKFHSGIDLAATTGTKVYATADGIIKSASREGVTGNCIIIDHGYEYETAYLHLEETFVKEGDKVKCGDVIATVGNTGKSIAPHLHYEVIFKTEPQNPANYLFREFSPSEYSSFLQKADDSGNVLD